MLSFSQFKDLFNAFPGEYEIRFNDDRTIMFDNSGDRFVVQYEFDGEIMLDMDCTGLDDILIDEQSIESLWPSVDDVIIDNVFSVKEDLANIVDFSGVSFDWYYLDVTDIVKATENIDCNGKIIEKGTKGTVVRVCNKGESFEVEFVDEHSNMINVVLCHLYQLQIWIKRSL